jgi:DNA-binding NtrC family response regulator
MGIVVNVSANREEGGGMREYAGSTLALSSKSYMVRPPHSDGSTECSRREILLVENEEAQGLLYGQELSEEGYLVIWARNGKEALKHLEESPCDLVVLDIVMPEMDGLEVLAKIVSRYKKMPVILHTAYAHYKNDFMTWLADAFVVKSSDVSMLKKTVKELLRKSGEEKGTHGVSAQEIRGLYETNP